MCLGLARWIDHDVCRWVWEVSAERQDSRLHRSEHAENGKGVEELEG